jgi:hypothetical protein
MKHFSAWATCISSTGVVFHTNIVVPATDVEGGVKLATEYLVKNGTTVTLMIGAPPVPIDVVHAIVQRIDEIDQQKISVVSQLPKELM